MTGAGVAAAATLCVSVSVSPVEVVELVDAVSASLAPDTDWSMVSAPSWRRAAAASTHTAGDSLGPAGPDPNNPAAKAAIIEPTRCTGAATNACTGDSATGVTTARADATVTAAGAAELTAAAGAAAGTAVERDTRAADPPAVVVISCATRSGAETALRDPSERLAFGVFEVVGAATGPAATASES